MFAATTSPWYLPVVVNGQIPVTLTERWNGTAWAIQPGPHPGAQGSSLAGVACPSASSCFAVGYYTKTGKNWSLAEHK